MLTIFYALAPPLARKVVPSEADCNFQNVQLNWIATEYLTAGRIAHKSDQDPELTLQEGVLFKGHTV